LFGSRGIAFDPKQGAGPPGWRPRWIIQPIKASRRYKITGSGAGRSGLVWNLRQRPVPEIAVLTIPACLEASATGAPARP
jgi:hypothetical protein